MKRLALKTAQGLVWLCLLALLALFGAGVSRSLSAGAQMAATNGDIHISAQAATNGDIHLNGQAETNGAIHVGGLAATEGDIHIGS